MSHCMIALYTCVPGRTGQPKVDCDKYTRQLRTDKSFGCHSVEHSLMSIEALLIVRGDWMCAL